jgi:hypothetical protein
VQAGLLACPAVCRIVIGAYTAPPVVHLPGEILTDSDKTKPMSPRGVPLYGHGRQTGPAAANAEARVDPISAHIAAHLGPAGLVFNETDADAVHLDIHVVEPSDAFPFARLVTSGMSDFPMATPTGIDVPRYAELVMTLPGDWKLDQKSFEDGAWYWPVALLRYLASFPHKHQTWLGWGHTVPNGDPAKPYASSTALSGAILLSPIGVPDAFQRLRVSEGKEVAFYSVVPLYREEIELAVRSGTDELLNRFLSKRISDVIDPVRENVAKKRFGFF